MDLTLTAEEAGFRDEVRTWMGENHPGPEPRSGTEDWVEFATEWQRKLHAAGWEYQDIATRLGVEVSTVRSHISDARKQLSRTVPRDWEGSHR